MNDMYDRKICGRRGNGKSIVLQIIIISSLYLHKNTTDIQTKWGSGVVKFTERKQIQSTEKEPSNKLQLL